MIIKDIIKQTSCKLIYFIIPVFGILFSSEFIYASFELHGYGARARAMGSAYVALANTSDALFINCSGTAQLTNRALSFFYTRPFGIKELDYFSASGAFPTTYGTFATGCTVFGNKIYQEQALIFNFSRCHQQKIYYGANLHCMKLQINGYGSDFSYKIDLGILIKISDNFNWGLYTSNINRAHMGEKRDYLPQSFISGISLQPLDKTTLNIDLHKELPFPLELRAGIEYFLFNRIALRSGFSSEPSTFSAGFGFHFNKISCDYAVTTHSDLGLTHHISFHLGF